MRLLNAVLVIISFSVPGLAHSMTLDMSDLGHCNPGHGDDAAVNIRTDIEIKIPVVGHVSGPLRSSGQISTGSQSTVRYCDRSTERFVNVNSFSPLAVAPVPGTQTNPPSPGGARTAEECIDLSSFAVRLGGFGLIVQPARTIRSSVPIFRRAIERTRPSPILKHLGIF